MCRSFVLLLTFFVSVRLAAAQSTAGNLPAAAPAVPAGGSAQQPQAIAPLPSTSAGAPPAGTAPAFVVQSDSGDNRLQLGALLQIDGRFAADDAQQNVVNNFNMRRLRAISQGRLARHFEFFLNTEFAGTLTIRDGYLDTVFSPSFRVRVGKARVPFSYDRNILLVNIPFIERGLTTNVAPDRDTGVIAMGDLAGGVISVFGSVMNGSVDGGSPDGDTNDGKDIAGRVVVRPWFSTTGRDVLRDFGVAVAANTGKQGAALPSFLSAGRQTFFSYAPGATGDGQRTRWSPQAFYYHGRFGSYGEFVRSRGDVRREGQVAEVDHDAWQVSATWVLTGEPASPERNVRPRNSFDPPTRHFGAVQLAARLQQLRVSDAAFDHGFAAPSASRRADVLTFGGTWYPNPYVKWVLNHERTVFDGDTRAARRPENTLTVRAQLGFRPICQTARTSPARRSY
jgi:phosphate-selective porin OprO/OprP